MSYQGPMLIREPDLRWPIVILAAIITAAMALVAAGMHYVASTQPYVNTSAAPRLEGSLRPGEPEFEQFREQIVMDQLVGTEKVHPFNNLAVEVTATVRNSTGRTITDSRCAAQSRTPKILRCASGQLWSFPRGKRCLAGETINVRVLLEGISPFSTSQYLIGSHGTTF